MLVMVLVIILAKMRMRENAVVNNNDRMCKILLCSLICKVLFLLKIVLSCVCINYICLLCFCLRSCFVALNFSMMLI